MGFIRSPHHLIGAEVVGFIGFLPCGVELLGFIRTPLTPLEVVEFTGFTPPFPLVLWRRWGSLGPTLRCGGGGIHQVPPSPLVWRWWGSLGSSPMVWSCRGSLGRPSPLGVKVVVGIGSPPP